MGLEPDKIKTILATDCGSTTSKARFFRKVGNEYRFVVAGEAPTTVEAPYEDVTLGVRNAVREIEELTGHKLLSDEGIIVPSKGDNAGVDLYVTTSSAGGGLQMMVSGLIKTMTAESAERAALGAGAIVMNVLATDDGRTDYEKIMTMRFLRPDLFLIAGGTDGGNINQLVELSQLVKLADPKARFGSDYKLPIVYAGNKDARESVRKAIGEKFALTMVDNLRPTLEIENTEPAREAVHEVFMEHVMSHAPGYDRLMKWTTVPIMPTPAGEGAVFQLYAKMRNKNVIGVGLGGATTNIYSIYDGRFVRSVSANLGMSYSICNVLREANMENIMRWIPFDIDETEVLNQLRNKMIRPTTIPQTLQRLMIEHAVAREALRLGFKHHKSLARPLLGGQVGEIDVGKILDEGKKERTQTYIEMLHINAIGATGGLLSHAPRRVQCALILADGFAVEGVVFLFVDSVFMMPHLGVMSTVHPKAALEIFEKDCLIRLGTCIAFSGTSKEEGRKIGDVEITMPGGNVVKREAIYGKISRIPLPSSETAKISVKPESGFDVGAGPGKQLLAEAEGGEAGILIDARGRPLELPTDGQKRKAKLLEWFRDLDMYPSQPENIA